MIRERIIMLKRKVETKIRFWMHNSQKALLIDEARQVGKNLHHPECPGTGKL